MVDWKVSFLITRAAQPPLSSLFLSLSYITENTAFLLSKTHPFPLPHLPTRTTHWVNSDHHRPSVLGSFSLSSYQKMYSIRPWKLSIIEVSHMKLLFVPAPLAVSSQASLLTALPLPNLKHWRLLAFIPDFFTSFPHSLSFSPSLPLWLTGLMILITFIAYILTVSKVISSAQRSLLNCRPSCLSHLDVSHAFHIQYVPNWTSGLATRYPPVPKCVLLVNVSISKHVCRGLLLGLLLDDSCSPHKCWF